MSTLTDRLSSLRLQNRKALSLFLTAGYPTLESTVPLVTGLVHAGADIIELGIPFSDPIADGPTIQLSSETALRNGVTLEKTLVMAREIRKREDIPLVLMGYANSLYAYGLPKFFHTCAGIGVDGVIIPDLPAEESTDYRRLAYEKGIATIFLAAPTTSDERLMQLDQMSTGFLYCVSVTGVTGERQGLSSQSQEFLMRARSHVRTNPLLVGFGIATSDDARRVSRYSDGVIIGSALMKVLGTSSPDQAADAAITFVKPIRTALDAME